MTFDMLDKTQSVDAGGFDANQNRTTTESHQFVHGYMTVVKNQGKENEEVLCLNKHNLLTNSGRDAMHDALYVDTTATQVGFNYIALSTNVGGADPTHTSLAGEITSGGLNRQVATTKSHSVGANTTVLARTFTATTTHTAVQLSGLFDASSSGVMGHEAIFTPASLENADTLSVTWTLTLG